MSFRTHITTLVMIALLVSSCSFDQDEGFRPDTTGLTVMVGDELFLFQKDAPPLSIDELVGDIATDEDQNVWIARPVAGVVERQDNSESINTEPLIPHFTAVANNHVLVVDTVREAIGFFDRKDRSLARQIDILSPGQVTRLLDKFYVVSGDSTVRVFLDQALTEINAIQLPEAIVDIQEVQNGGLVLSLGGMPRRAARIGYLTEALSEPPFNRSNLSANTPCNWIDQRFSPYVQALYGTEWTASVVLCEDSIRSGSIAFGAGASSMAVDFYAGICFFTQNQTLYAYSLRSQAIVNEWEWSGGLLGKGAVSFR